MVYIYHNGIDIPSFLSSHMQFYMVPVWFFTDAYTWHTYTIMALTSPHSKVCMYSSIRFLYSSLQMPTHGIHRLYHNGIDIPSFQSLHIQFFTDAFTCVYFLYHTLHLHFCITGFYTAHHCGAKK